VRRNTAADKTSATISQESYRRYWRSGGLGKASARLLASQGPIVYARRKDHIQALAEELTKGGYKAIAVATDVTDRDQVKKLVDIATLMESGVEFVAADMPFVAAVAEHGRARSAVSAH
jgi:NAD(P)-dependent dehydrogenase (short-subunit alcohol dehydrogenase family)